MVESIMSRVQDRGVRLRLVTTFPSQRVHQTVIYESIATRQKKAKTVVAWLLLVVPVTLDE